MYNQRLSAYILGCYSFIGLIIATIICILFFNKIILIPLVVLFVFFLIVIFLYKYRTSGATFEKEATDWLKELYFKPTYSSPSENKTFLELKKEFFFIAFPTYARFYSPEIKIYPKELSCT